MSTRPAMPVPSPDDTGETYWDAFYSRLELPPDWSPNPNALLVHEIGPEVGDEAPGTALDLGCGAGGDAIWLAERGWHVTAVDISRAVLRRAAEFAERAGVADRIQWEHHDLTRTFPTGEFALVSTQFLHSPVERGGDRDAIMRRAMAAVASGGTLLVIGHVGYPSWMDEPPFDVHLPSTAETFAALNPDPAHWKVVTNRIHVREIAGPGDEPGTREDGVLRLRRATDPADRAE